MKTRSARRRAAAVDTLCSLRDDHGGIAVAIAIALTVMIGFGATATEIGTWLLTRRAMQGAADAAAVSALNATARGGPDITTQARGIAAQNGWTHGVNGVTVTVNQPPSVGNFTGNAQAVEVIIGQAQPLFFSGMLPGVTAPTIRARGVAAPSPTTGNGCMLALDTGDSISVQGNGALTLSGCDLDGNGNISFSGNHSAASAHSIDIKGTVSSPSQLTLTSGPGTQNDPVGFTDPYAGQRSFSKPASCVPFAGTFTPGAAYCGVNISGGTISMPSGVYYIEGGVGTCGGFCVSGGATLTSATGGVTIVLTNTGTGPYATLNITGNPSSSVSLTAISDPTATTRGLVFFQDPAAPAGQTETIAGNGNVSIEGAIYFPKGYISLSGNGNLHTPGCLQVIGLRIIDSGNATLASNCVGTGTNGIGHGAGAIRLVE